jgi:TetR/AcrR family transcriptional regulator
MDTRETIIACAVKLFASRGYDAIGIQEIVNTAGITKPTLYYYFGSKKGILEAIAAQFFGDLKQSVATAAEYQHDITATLARIVNAFFEFAIGNQDFYRMQLGMNFASPENEANQIIRQQNEEIFQLVEAVFEQAAQDHGNMKGRHAAYAASFIGMINTYVGLALNGYLTLDEKLSFQALHQFMHGIFS